MKIAFDIDIDEQEWAQTYPKDMADLPTAVTEYARSVVTDLFVDLGLARDATDV